MDFGGDIGTLQRRVSDVPEGTKRRLLAFDALDLVPGLRVLEIGCGGGQLASNISPALGADGQYFGLDANDEQLAAARTTYADVPNCEFVHGDAIALPFDDGSFDRVVAINSALEVDLTGQICADSLGHRIYSGIGGQMDFSARFAIGEDGKATGAAMIATPVHRTISPK